MFKLRHLTLIAILVFGTWALWPPPDRADGDTEADGRPAADAKYTIRISPGLYMPGRRPQNVGEKLKALDEVAAEFRKHYPDTAIEFVDMPGSREYLVTQLVGEQAPDVININVEDVWQDVQKGWYVPLDPYLDRPNPFVPKGQPGSRRWWDMFKYQAITRGKAAPDGKMYCLTLDMIETGIFYNKKIFREVGVQPPRTWAEFLDIQDKLQRAGYMPMLVDQSALSDWGVDLMFDQLYRSIRRVIDLKQDPLRAGYMKGYLDWDEIAFLYRQGFFRVGDPRWQEVFRLLKDWRSYFPKDLGAVSMERLFITQKGAMYWSSSFTVNKLVRDKDIAFDWGVFYLPKLTAESSPFASNVEMCVIGGAATQLSITNSAFNDTKRPETSEKLKRVVAFLQFLCVPKNTERVVNEVLCLLPNIVGVPPRKELQPFDEILSRDYTMTKWSFTFDLRFNDIFNRTFFLFLQDGMTQGEFMEWMDKNIGSAVDTIVRRKDLDLTQFEATWQRTATERATMEGLPSAARS